MGMFDRLLDTNGTEWQTKAFGRTLESYRIGDLVTGGPFNYQVEILGGDHHLNYVDSYATIRDGVLESVNDPRDETQPLLDYSGTWTAPKGA